MEVRDNKDKLLFNLQMENVRLNNEKASLKEYISLHENELKSIDEEHAQELALKDEFIADQAETISKLHKEKDSAKADAADARKELDEARAVILSLQGQISQDTSNLPEGSKLIYRKDKASGEDVWTVVLLHYQGPKTLRTEQEVGRFNVPKNDPMCSKHP